MLNTRGIDFSHLSLRDALDLAILIEEEARERYLEFADQMDLHDTPEAAHFFRFMAGNEQKHRDELAARRQKYFGDAPTQLSLRAIFDVEAPEYDEARAFMTVREALAAALRSEQKAAAFFAATLPKVATPEVRQLFSELHAEEQEHERLVRAQLEKAPADPAIHPSTWADDPYGTD